MADNDPQGLEFFLAGRPWATDSEQGPVFEPFHRRFEAIAREQANAPALHYREHQLSYEELDQRANRLAQHLVRLGADSSSKVCVCVEPSFDILIAMLAVFKAGAVYVPLDPTHPPARLHSIIEDTKPLAILTQSGLRDSFDFDESSAFCFDTHWEQLNDLSLCSPDLDVTEEQIAYIFYTSGTTGKPKGVEASHGNLAHYLSVARDKYQFSRDDAFCTIARFTFSISMFELLSPLACGGQLRILDREHILDIARLADTLESVTVVHLGPSLLRALLQHVGSDAQPRVVFEGMRHASSGGDLVPPDVLERMKVVFPNAEIYVIYGCTEISCMGTTYPVPRDQRIRRTFVGKCFPGMSINVVNADGSRVAVDEIGEVVFGGRGVTQGYLGQPELSAERFFDDEGTRYYRTGDVGRLNSAGELELLGRQDFQIQLHGVRIELGEVETTMRAAPGIQDAVAAARDNEQGEKLLVGYLVGSTPADVDVQAVRAYIRERLPDYSVPSLFVVLEKIPLNHNLKVDRLALPAPTRENTGHARGMVAAVTSTEKLLVEICSELLGIDDIGMEDELFASGASSLTALGLNTRVRERLGVAIPLTSLFAGKSLGQLASELDALAATVDTSEKVSHVSSSSARPALSPSQKRIWYAHELAGQVAVYNVPQVFEVDSAVDPDRLERALNSIVERHEMLRMFVVSLGLDAEPRFLSQVTLPLEVVDLNGQDSASQLEAELAVRIEEPFDLSRAPLVRASLFRQETGPATLLLNFHHIIYDEFSSRVLTKELGLFYDADGEPVSLPALSMQASDYALAEAQRSVPVTWQAELNYWQATLQPLAPVLDLPLDKPRPASRAYTGKSIRAVVAAQTASQLSSLAKSRSGSLFMVLLAAWSALLRRLSNQQDIVVGTAVANRLTQASEELIGCFINLVALRTHVDPDACFTDLLQAVRESCLGALENSSVPFDEVVRTVAPPRDSSRTPLFQNMLIFEELSKEEAVGELQLKVRESALYTSQTDVALWVRETGDGLELMLNYDLALFSNDSMQVMLDHFTSALDSIAASHGTQQISEIDFSGARERLKLRELNHTEVDVPAVATFIDLFEEAAERHQDKIALQDAAGTMTYRELEHRASQAASQLRAQGVSEGDFVGVCLPRDRDLVIAVLAVLKSGGAYVPLDPTYPKDRIAHMVTNSGLTCVIASPDSTAILPAGPKFIELSEQGDEATESVARTLNADNLAYVIYTSGSTGLPKGVAVPHGAVLNFLSSMQQCPGLTSEDCLLAVTTLSFDISVLELFLPLITGAQVLVASDEECRDAGKLSLLLNKHPVTVMQATPATWRMLINSGHSFASGFRALCGGEPLPQDLAQALMDQGVELWNMYGPTETTVWSSCEHVTDPTDITVGRPIHNTAFYILDEAKKRVPIGVSGELYIGGLGVTQGYLGRSDLTSERFIPDPFRESRGATMYQTGDCVRLLPDGRYQHRGRLDSQVKLRGFRIELGEIENAHRDLELADDCAVALHTLSPTDVRLVTYLVGAVDLDAKRLRNRLSAKLPAYMLPHHFLDIERIPKTPAGKIDRAQLSAQAAVRIGQTASLVAAAPPRTETEAALVQIFSESLGVDSVGIDDDFFALGGHSLLAVHMVAEMRNHFGVDTPLGFVFEAPSVRQLAERLAAGDSLITRPILLSDNSQLPPLFMLVGIHLYSELAQRLGDSYSVYSVLVRMESLMAEDVQGTPSVEELAEAYVEVIRVQQPHGPYRLGGMSFGGLVAYEVAQRLCALGETVEQVILLDSWLPERGFRRWWRAIKDLTRKANIATLRSAIGRQREAEDPADQGGALDRLGDLRRQGYTTAAINYTEKMKGYEGQVTLVLSAPSTTGRRGVLSSRFRYWSELIPNLHIETVAAGHLEMLKDPGVDKLAPICLRRLGDVAHA